MFFYRWHGIAHLAIHGTGAPGKHFPDARGGVVGDIPGHEIVFGEGVWEVMGGVRFSEVFISISSTITIMIISSSITTTTTTTIISISRFVHGLGFIHIHLFGSDGPEAELHTFHVGHGHGQPGIQILFQNPGGVQQLIIGFAMVGEKGKIHGGGQGSAKGIPDAVFLLFKMVLLPGDKIFRQ